MTGFSLPGTYHGFAIEKLLQFYELVKPRCGCNIFAIVHAENLSVVAVAIDFCAGVKPTFQVFRHPWYRVCADIANKGESHGQLTKAP